MWERDESAVRNLVETTRIANSHAGNAVRCVVELLRKGSVRAIAGPHNCRIYQPFKINDPIQPALRSRAPAHQSCDACVLWQAQQHVETIELAQ